MMTSPLRANPRFEGHMERETLPDTTPERSGTTGGSGAAGQQQAAFSGPAETAQTRKYHVTIDDESGCVSTLEAASWDEAMKSAASYMDEGDWNADECGTQQIGYTVYRLPAGSDAELGDNNWIDRDVLYELDCPSKTAVHVQQPTEPDCTETEHDFIATKQDDGGLEANPGVFGHGGSVVIKDHCRHCGLPRTTDHWDDVEDTNDDRGKVTYGEAPEEWARQNRDGDPVEEAED